MEIKEIRRLPRSKEKDAAAFFPNSAFGGIEVKFEHKGKEGKALFQVSGTIGAGYVGGCGAQNLNDSFGSFVRFSFGANNSIFADGGKAAAGMNVTKWQKNKADFKKIQEALLATLAEELCHKGSAIMFGGKVNINRDKYLGNWGVYSGTLAAYLKKHKIGTLTVSHAYQNPSHFSGSDFSVQQFFVWTGPKGIVLPAKVCGIFNYKERTEDGIKAVIAKIKQFKEKSIGLMPTYCLKDPLKYKSLFTEEGTKKEEVDKAA